MLNMVCTLISNSYLRKDMATYDSKSWLPHDNIQILNENETLELNAAKAGRKMSHPTNGRKLQTTIP